MKRPFSYPECLISRPVADPKDDFCSPCNKLVQCQWDERGNPRCPQCSKIVWEAAARTSWAWKAPPPLKKETPT